MTWFSPDESEVVALGDLKPEALMAVASAEAALTDWGGEQFIEPLTRWLVAVVAEANLNPVGVLGVKGTAVRNLVSRLRTQDALKKHPEILQEEIVAPILVTGMPRTGTTKLQRMLSSDPEVQGLVYWRLLNVAPLPGHQPGEPDPRRAMAEASVRYLAETAPDLMAGHPIGVDEVEEDISLMDPTFETHVMVGGWHVPSFDAWWRHRDRRNSYAYEKRVLQFLQWQDGGGQGRPWILKSPAHLDALDALAATYPGATVVHCHRDLNVAVPSLVGLYEVSRRMAVDDLDPVELGDEVVGMWSDTMDSYVAMRERLDGPLRFVDVSYEAIVSDPVSVVRRVYDVHGRGLTPESERRMLDWEKENPQHRFGKMGYSLERYGLTTDRIAEAFSSYSRWLETTASASALGQAMFRSWK